MASILRIRPILSTSIRSSLRARNTIPYRSNSSRLFSVTANNMTWWNDGRESRVLKHLKTLPSNELKDNPTAILDAINKYSRQSEKTFLMNIGPEKGKYVTDLITSQKPKVMVELGGYVGYSSMLFSSLMKKVCEPGAKYYSLERSEEFAGIMKEMLEMAGLTDMVTIIVGLSSDGIDKLKDEYGVDKVDILFIDHFEEFFVPDLKKAERLGLVQPGSVVLADNVIMPGAPKYLEYVQMTAEEKRRARALGNASGGEKDVIYENEQKKGKIPVGDQIFEDAVNFSRCTEYI